MIKQIYYYATALPVTAYVTAPIFANFVTYAPIYIGGNDASTDGTTIETMSIEVTTAVAASTLTIGLYSSVAGEPNTRLWQSAAISSATTGIKTATVTYKAQPGWYWAALNVSASGVSVRSNDNLAVPALIGLSSLGFATPSAYFEASVYATTPLPATATIGGHITSDNPAFLLRAT